MLPDSLTLARKQVLEGLSDGTTCPCCGQKVKRYKRSIYRAIAQALVKLEKLDRLNPRFYHLDGICGGSAYGGDFAKLQHWGLIEHGETGYWRITELGRRFARGEESVPKYGYFFNGECQKLGGPSVTIAQCLARGFRKHEVLAAAA